MLVRQMEQMKNRVSGLLLETGVSHNKQRLHKVGYFRDLISKNEEVPESIFFFLNFTPTTDIYPLPPHDALPISVRGRAVRSPARSKPPPPQGPRDRPATWRHCAFAAGAGTRRRGTDRE